MRKGLTCARDRGKTHSAWRVFHGQKLACAPAIRALTEIIVTAKHSWSRMLPFRWGRVASRVSSSLPTRRSSNGATSNWADGRAVLSIYARPNKAGETPRTYLRKNLRVKSGLDYVRIARSFFAISSERDDVILYSRCNFSGGARGVIHCFDLKYPREEKRSWDAVVTRISLSLRPLES